MNLLQDENGKELVVNGEPPKKYENLSSAGRERVSRILRWKDINRVSDRAYAKARSSASNTLPPSKHLKQEEKQLNLQLPQIRQVQLLKFWMTPSSMKAERKRVRELEQDYESE